MGRSRLSDWEDYNYLPPGGGAGSVDGGWEMCWLIYCTEEAYPQWKTSKIKQEIDAGRTAFLNADGTVKEGKKGQVKYSPIIVSHAK